MLGMFSSKTASELRKSCEDSLRKSGWKVKGGSGQPEDLEIECGILKYHIECADQSVMDYKSVDSIIEQLANHCRNRSTWIPLVFVFNFKLPFYSFDDLLEKNIVALSIGEIELVCELPSYLKDLNKEMSQRQRALVESNTWACVELAEKCREGGDLVTALSWARKAIKPTDPVNAAHRVVFGILLKIGAKEDAYALASEAVIRRRDDIFLLKGLLSIAQERGDTESVRQWSRLIENVGAVKIRGIDRLLQPAENKNVNKPVSLETSLRSRLTNFLLRRPRQGR